MPNVCFFTSKSPEIASLLTAAAPQDFETSVFPIDLSDNEKIPHVQDADFLILFPGIVSEPVLRSAKRLKLIQLVSAGFDQLDLNLCRELGIPVANNGGTNAIDVAEHTVMLILAFYRRLVEMDAIVRQTSEKTIDSGDTTFTIHGKTVGIVGLGNIGRKTARLLNAFGAEVLYADAIPAPSSVERDLAVRRVALDDLLVQADIVTLHVPLNKQTAGMIASRELALMKPSALLVNTCRGPVVDESALIEALQQQMIAGAALDVLTQEPPDASNPLLLMDNVLLTPHTAGVTRDTWPRRGQFIYENLRRVWQGQPPQAVVSA